MKKLNKRIKSAAPKSALELKQEEIDDLTERLLLSEKALKISNEKLDQTESDLKKAREIDNIGSWTYYIETKTIWGSLEALRLFGFKKDSGPLTLEIIERCMPDRLLFHKALADLVEDGKPFDLEMKINPIDDSPQRILISKAVVEKDKDGSPLYVAGIIQDVTHLRQAEKSLKIYKAVIDSCFEAISITTPPGEIVYSNLAHQRLFNYPGIDTEILCCRDFFTPESKEILFQQIVPLLVKGENWEGELEAADTSGRKFPLWATFGTILDETGNVINGFGFMHDISNRVMIENEIKKQKEVYQLITERSNDLIYIYRLKPDPGFEYVSPSAERITGYTPEDHYNNPNIGFEIIHPDDVGILDTLKNGKVSGEVIRIRWIKKDGSIIWTEQSNIPIYDPNGEIIAIQGKATDITERIHAEQILEARLRISEHSISHTREEVQRFLLDELEKLTHSTIGFFHVVKPDQKTLALQCWSTNTLAIMCRTEVKEHLYSIEKAGVWVDCFYRKKPVVHNDYMSLTNRKGLPDGHSAIVRELVVPVMRNENVVAIIGIGNKPSDYNKKDIEIVSLLSDMTWDIAERKGIEEELLRLNAGLEMRVEERTIQLTSAFRSMEAFSYSVSHDLNAPLRHIKGYIDILKDISMNRLTEQELKCLDTIDTSVDEMRNLIEALLTFSHIHQTGLNKNLINNNVLVNQSIQFFLAGEETSKTEFRVEQLPDSYGDERLIKQVWINLISNAIKYSGKKANAIIEIGSITNSVETIFSVKDNGVGFDTKYADRLFGVFQRLHDKADFKGVGIGLANVNSIVTRHNGRCYAEGEVDKGATFYFTLPKI